MKTITSVFVLFLISISLLFAQDTIEVNSGWNMIGAISTISLDKISTEPPGIITSSYFGYGLEGYSSKDTLKKGKGYWIKTTKAGFILTTNQPPFPPNTASPLDNETGVSTSPILSWTCADPNNDFLVYDVYFGTDNPPTTKVSSGQNETSLNRNGLSNGTAYYWRVVVKDNHNNSTVGAIWSFITNFNCGQPILHANKSYNTVSIGTQCWLKENLDIGTMLDSLQNQSDDNFIEKYCYKNDTANCTFYGGLYQWDEAMQYSTIEGSQGICPLGWHIPTHTEFQELKTIVNGNGNALKEMGQGSGGGVGTNTSGFSALLAGDKDHTGRFHNLHYFAEFWNSSSENATLASVINLTYNDIGVGFGVQNVTYGYSIRCIKN